MSQLSRPFQIALAVFALVAVVWFAALRGHHGEPNPAPATSKPSAIYHGSAPGVEGLTRDIAKAHRAAGQEQQHAHRVESQSSSLAEEPAATKSASAGSKASHSRSTSSTSHRPSSSVASRAGSSNHQSAGGAKGQSASAPARQASLQHELSHGKVVVLLFWNPRSTDDQAVRNQLHVLSRRDGHVSIHVATPSEITSFGGYTRGVQVSQTPTTLIINAKNQITTLSGLTDARSIQQTIGDALKGGSGEGQFRQVSFTAVLHGTHLASREKFIAKAESMCKIKRFYLARTKK